MSLIMIIATRHTMKACVYIANLRLSSMVDRVLSYQDNCGKCGQL